MEERMGLNDAPSAERLQISFFGVRNAGKSSLVNAVTGQNMAVVSDAAGTTTDPVRKAMELLPLGPVVIIDTPGIDDTGALGELRVEKTKEVLRSTHVAVLVAESGEGLTEADRDLIRLFREKGIPFVLALSKADLPEKKAPIPEGIPKNRVIRVSARTGYHVRELKDLIAEAASGADKAHEAVMFSDLLNAGDRVVLVCPIDSAAPKGRLILPEQMAVREVLDAGGLALVTRETELERAMEAAGWKPRMVVTDSQAFGLVSKVVPRDVPLTSFSILVARRKGNLRSAVKNAGVLSNLQDGDRVLISEGCTHHRQCDDIGTVKIPDWIRSFAGCEPKFRFTSGRGFPDDLKGYRLIVHCGGCMLNEQEMQYRYRRAEEQGVPMINYGIAIAKMHGILDRSIEPFVDELADLTESQYN